MSTGRGSEKLVLSDGGRSDSASRTVLLAEDDNDLRETYSIWLPDDRWTVREAANGAEAIQKLDEGVDVLVLDRHMPRLSGPEVVDRLGHTPFDGAVVVLSAYRPDDHLDGSDVTSYVTKPVDPESFRSHLRRAVQ